MRRLVSSFIILIQIISLLVFGSEIFNPSKAYIKHLAIGIVLLCFGLNGLVKKIVSTRISVIDKQKNKILFYIMIASYFVLALIFLKYSYELWIKS